MEEKAMYEIKDLILIPFKNAFIDSAIIAAKKIIDGIIPTIKVVITAMFLDNSIAIYNGEKSFKDIILPILFLMIIISYEWISNQINRFANTKLENKLRITFRKQLLENIAELKYKYIENSESWDLISRIIKQPESQCAKAYIDTGDMICMVIKIFGILALLFTKVWWISIAILLISVPLFKLSLRAGKECYDSSRESQVYNRKVEYLSEILNGRNSVEERCLFGYSEEINKEWEEAFETSRKITYKIRLKWFINSKLSGSITAILSILILLILIAPVKQGAISIGMFISIESTVMNLIQLLSYKLPTYGDRLSQNREYLVDLNVLNTLEKNKSFIGKPSLASTNFETLEFKNVSFKYPGSNNYILNNMSFIINKGKTYAFVGVNGAGKTTITKLIVGLYEDFEGEILINGKSIKSYSKNDIKGMCSVIFQDFAKYYISVNDNIMLGNINNNLSEDRLETILQTLDLTNIIHKLPKKINSNLGKIKEDGVDLSGGEWQRIAMARFLASDASLKILDEPTAALDPISESAMYERLKKIIDGKTSILISHRLASTKLADEIFVIEKGRVIEKGSYDELINQNGIYACMYNSQRSWYE